MKEYNQFMGRIDLLGALTALYKFPKTSRRQYFYMFLHTICTTVVTSWLWCKRHCCLLGLTPMKLSRFQSDVAAALVQIKRLGWQPTVSPTPNVKAKKPRLPAPIMDMWLNSVGHLPEWVARNHCKYSTCKAKTYVQCCKCKVLLCLNKDRNCFRAFQEQKWPTWHGRRLLCHIWHIQNLRLKSPKFQVWNIT